MVKSLLTTVTDLLWATPGGTQGYNAAGAETVSEQTCLLN